VREGHRVQIDDAIDAGVRRLHLDEALQRAEIIAEVQIAGRLHAGEYAFGELRHIPLRTLEMVSGLMTMRGRRRKTVGVWRGEGAFYEAPRRVRSQAAKSYERRDPSLLVTYVSDLIGLQCKTTSI
jgi:hypothetical protein